jgi:hypothetical protein
VENALRVPLGPIQAADRKDRGTSGLRGRKGGRGSTGISTEPGSSKIFSKSCSLTVSPVSSATPGPGRPADLTRTREGGDQSRLRRFDRHPAGTGSGCTVTRSRKDTGGFGLLGAFGVRESPRSSRRPGSSREIRESGSALVPLAPSATIAPGRPQGQAGPCRVTGAESATAHALRCQRSGALQGGAVPAAASTTGVGSARHRRVRRPR